MDQFALDRLVVPRVLIHPGETFEQPFGPPTPGAGRVLLPFVARVDLPAVVTSFRRTTPGGFRSTRLDLGRGRFDSGIQDPEIGGGGGGDGPRTDPVPPTIIQVEVVDAGGDVVASGRGPLDFEVPPAGRTVVVGVGSPWTVRLTNTRTFDVLVSLDLLFRGNRPIISQPVDLEFINDKLDAIFNDLQPLAIRLENQEVARVTIRGGDGEPREVPIIHTVAVVEADPEWALAHPDLAGGPFDLGARVIANSGGTSLIQLAATVHDGAFALRLRVGLTPGLVIDVSGVLQAALSGARELGARALAELTLPDFVTLEAFSLDVFLVLRTEDEAVNPGRATFEILTRPRIRADSNRVAQLLEGLLQVGLERELARRFRGVLREHAFNLLGWLLGERGREVVGSTEALEILYAGEPRRIDVAAPDETPRPSPDFSPGNLAKIDHIVVLMMENRSFDHMLGFASLPVDGRNGLKGLGRCDVNGLGGDETNPLNTRGERRGIFSFGVDTDLFTRGSRFPFDPDHGFNGTKLQRGDFVIESPRGTPGRVDQFDADDLIGRRFPVGPNEGFILSFARRLDSKYGLDSLAEQRLRGEVMGFQPPGHVPMYEFFLQEFGVCDAWFAALPGPTWPNRFITLTGHLITGPDGRAQVSNPEVASFDPLEDLTLFDHLSAAEVDWRYYEHDLGFLRLFSRYTFDTERVVAIDDPERGFFAAAARGELPAVSFIDPDFIDVPPGNDDHPPSDLFAGQQLIKRIYDALATGPAEQWQRSLLVITYDEHGGFYDHVHPQCQALFDPGNPLEGGFVPLALDPDTGEPVDHYGMRVPALAVSPFIPRAEVLSRTLDHTGLANTIISRFLAANPPDLGPRVDLANNLEPLLSLEFPREAPPSPRVPPPLIRSAPPRSNPRDPEDFHRFVGEVRARFRAR